MKGKVYKTVVSPAMLYGMVWYGMENIGGKMWR